MIFNWYEVDVICTKNGAHKRRLLNRLIWRRDDLEFVAALRGDDSKLTEPEIQWILLNDRLTSGEQWQSRRGDIVSPPNPINALGDPAVDELDAVRIVWVFKCPCGMDKPFRAEKLDALIAARVEQRGDTYKIRLDISDPTAILK